MHESPHRISFFSFAFTAPNINTFDLKLYANPTSRLADNYTYRYIHTAHIKSFMKEI